MSVRDGMVGNGAFVRGLEAVSLTGTLFMVDATVGERKKVSKRVAHSWPRYFEGWD